LIPGHARATAFRKVPSRDHDHGLACRSV